MALEENLALKINQVITLLPPRTPAPWEQGVAGCLQTPLFDRLFYMSYINGDCTLCYATTDRSLKIWHFFLKRDMQTFTPLLPSLSDQ
jgi:hypothetical protein